MGRERSRGIKMGRDAIAIYKAKGNPSRCEVSCYSSRIRELHTARTYFYLLPNISADSQEARVLTVVFSFRWLSIHIFTFVIHITNHLHTYLPGTNYQAGVSFEPVQVSSREKIRKKRYERRYCRRECIPEPGKECGF